MSGVEGAVVAGRYELLEQIGTGGSGAVFRAHDRVLDRDVALKMMRPGADDDARARLRIEARLSGLLAHPGIVRVHDYGEEQVGAQTAPYLVMEYVEGESLREVLRREAPLSPDRTMGLVAQVADALAVAHAAGIVHRDVKPSNILVRPSGALALIDFGIARGRDVEPVTLTGTIVGTVDYISPEQAAGAGATARSDLYALGLLAYECLTGERPLRRDSQVATVLAHVNEDVPPLPRSVPAPVRDLVQRLTARDPRRRPADAATVAVLARGAVGATASLPAPVPFALRRGSREDRPAGRRGVRRLAVAGVAAATLVSGLLLAGEAGLGRPPAAAPANAVPDVSLGSEGASTRTASVVAPSADAASASAVPVVAPTAPAAKRPARTRSTSAAPVRKPAKAKAHHKAHHNAKGRHKRH